MGNSPSTQNTVVKYNGWMRVQIALDLHIKDALLTIFHNDDNDSNYNGFNRDSNILYNEMCQFKSANQKNIGKAITQIQWNILCPSAQSTDTKEMDITLLCAVLRNIVQPPPQNGWKFPIATGDTTKASYILKVRDLRNRVKHSNMDDFTDVQFRSCWRELDDILTGLNYGDLDEFRELKNGPLERHTCIIISKLEEKVCCMEIEQRTALETLKHEVEALGNRVENLVISDVPDLTDESCAEFSRGQLNSLAERTVCDWHRIIRHLGVEKHIIERIELDYPNSSIERAYQGYLHLFKMKEEISKFDIYNALDLAGRNDVRKILEGNTRAEDGLVHYVRTEDRIGYVCHISGDDDDPHMVDRSFIFEPPTSISINYLSRKDSKITMRFDELSDKFLRHYEESFPGMVASIHLDEVKVKYSDHAPIASKICGVQNVPDQEITSSVNMIKGWLRDENSHSLIVTGYHTEEHRKFLLGCSEVPKLCKKKDKFLSNKQRVLVFNLTRDIIINIRLSKAKSIGEIKHEIMLCNLDLKAVSSLNYRWLKESGIILMGLVFLSEVDKTKLANMLSCICDGCKALLVPKEDIHSEITFSRWWESTHLEHIKFLKNSFVGKVREKVSAMKRITSHVYGYMSTVNVTLPQFTCSPGEKIGKIMLNLEQHYAIQFIHSKRRVFLRGTFGSGKSIVGGEIVKQLARSATIPTQIYHLCGESHSLLNTKMLCESRNLLEELKEEGKDHVHIITTSLLRFSLQHHIKNTLDEIVIQIFKNRKENEDVHVVIDEFDNEDLSQEVAENLRTYFSQNNMFTRYIGNAIVLIIVNPLLKRRQIEFDRFGIDRKGIERNFQLTGFRQKIINKLMRSTIDIAALYRVSKRIIEENPSKFAMADIEKNSIRYADESPVTSPKITKKTLEASQAKINENNDDDTASDESGLYERDPDLDCVFKAVTQHYTPISSRKLVSQFKFSGGNHVGHQIQGSIPYVIFTERPSLDMSPSKFNAHVYLVSHILRSIQVKPGCIITCTNRLEVDLFSIALKKLNKPYITHVPSIDLSRQINIELYDIDLLSNDIIITDYVGCRGMETNQLIVCLSEDEYYERHCIIESFTRCRSSLYFFVTAAVVTNGMKKERTFRSILNEWAEKKLIKEIGASVDDEGYCVFDPQDEKFKNSEINEDWLEDSYTQFQPHYDEFNILGIDNTSTITNTLETLENSFPTIREDSFSTPEHLDDIQNDVLKFYFGRVTMEIKSYSRMRKEAPKAFYSNIFYSSTRGYKLRLRVYGTSAHIFGSVKIVSGEYDDELKWPFPINYAITVLHPYDETKNIRKVIFVNELPDYCNERPEGVAGNKTRSQCIVSYEKIRCRCIPVDDVIYMRCELLH